MRSVEFLGPIISSEDVEVDPSNTEAVNIFPRTLDPMDIRSFLGLAGYYRGCVDEFVSPTSSFTTLTQKNVKFEWSNVTLRKAKI